MFPYSYPIAKQLNSLFSSKHRTVIFEEYNSLLVKREKTNTLIFTKVTVILT